MSIKCLLYLLVYRMYKHVVLSHFIQLFVMLIIIHPLWLVIFMPNEHPCFMETISSKTLSKSFSCVCFFVFCYMRLVFLNWFSWLWTVIDFVFEAYFVLIENSFVGFWRKICEFSQEFIRKWGKSCQLDINFN